MIIEEELNQVITDFFKDNYSVEIENHSFSRPKLKEHGDLSSNIAMMKGKALNKIPRDFAKDLIEEILWPDSVAKIEVAGPGFLNFFLKDESIYQILIDIEEQNEKYGNNESGGKQKTLVEFVSANPTGPLTVGHGRNAVLGDTFSRILEANGYKVDREYYFNNAGRQMRVLGHSVYYRYLELCGEKPEFPEGHYEGEYIIEIAKIIFNQYSDKLINEKDNDVFRKTAEEEIFKDIKSSLEKLSIKHDYFFNEEDLYKNGSIKELLKTFKEKKLSYEKDGAVWLKTSELGFETDRVIVKNTGEPTYRLPDMAYHKGKFERGYERIIDIFGADHIDAYPDVLAAVKELGYDVSKIHVIIYQFVTLLRNGKVVKMSTRKANFVTLDELVEDVGADVVRFFINMRTVNTHLNFDLELAKKQSDENPVFYVQYAHARISSILKRSKEKDLSDSREHIELLTTEFELDLIKKAAEFPKLIKQLGENLEQHRLCSFLTDLASLYHKFNQNCMVLDDQNRELSSARLYLIERIQQVLKNGFYILGISAPDKM
jgi:arginyl-tRNA synthetase